MITLLKKFRFSALFLTNEEHQAAAADTGDTTQRARDSTVMSSPPPGLIQKFESWDAETRRISRRESKQAWSPPGLEDTKLEDEELEEVPSVIENKSISSKATPTTSPKERKRKDRRGSGRRYSFETVRRMSANITKMFTPTRRGSASQNSEHRGRVFWLHHGECTNDEKNALTGVIDASLTEFGVHQATKAGRDLARIVSDNKIKINVVYSSYMLRALETVKQVIEQDGVVEEDCQYFVRGDLAGRSFGVFTNTNQSLLRSALGFEIFENLVHSSEASPLGGEGIVSVHRRCERFYTKQILPHLLIGDNVLVVTHSCNLNVMAYVLCLSVCVTYKQTHTHSHTHTQIRSGKKRNLKISSF